MNTSQKVKLTLLVDGEVVQKAKDIGLNLSKTCERAFKEAIKRLESSGCESNDYKKTGPPGFEPGLEAPEAPVLSRLYYEPFLYKSIILF